MAYVVYFDFEVKLVAIFRLLIVVVFVRVVFFILAHFFIIKSFEFLLEFYNLFISLMRYETRVTSSSLLLRSLLSPSRRLFRTDGFLAFLEEREEVVLGVPRVVASHPHQLEKS